MSAGYTKLFAQILDSTVWREGNSTRILWITMLAMADRDGIVKSSIPGLADRARISIEDCETGLERFQQADKYSSSQVEDGRRIRAIDGGWLLINHSKYRALMSAEDQREKARIRKQNQRARGKECDMSRPVTPGHECHDIAKADTKAKAKARNTKTTIGIDKVTSKILLDLGMGGPKAKALLRDALEAYVHCHKCSLMGAADALIDLWRKYDAIPRLYKKGIIKFFEEGIWNNHDGWLQKPKIAWAADEARRQLAEERSREQQRPPTKLKTAFEEAREEAAEREAQRNSLGVDADYHLPEDLDRDAGEEIWRSALGKLEALINRHSLDTWLRPVKSAGVRDQVLYLKLPTVNFSNVGDKYATELAEVLPGLTVEFLIPQARGVAAD